MKYIINPAFRFLVAVCMLTLDFLMCRIMQFWLFIWNFSNKQFKEEFPKEKYFFHPLYQNYYYITFSDFIFQRKTFKNEN